MVNTPDKLSDIIIIGGGPAGLTASIYAARLGLKTLLFEAAILGGRAVQAPKIWNFPGFPEGLTGIELADRMVKQAEKFGTEMRISEEVLDLNLNEAVKTVSTRFGKYQCLGVIVSTGAQRKKLLLPGETEFLGRGVSYCAICDGPLFRGKTAAVIGSGNEAFEDALYLSSVAGRVFIITQSAKIESARALVKECKGKPNVEIVKATLSSVGGNDFVNSITILELDRNRERPLPVDGVFVSVGEVPMTNLVKKAGVKVDDRGCIKVDRSQATNLEGVYAAGDCTCGGMQIVTAAGEGAMAAMQAYRYVQKVRA